MFQVDIKIEPNKAVSNVMNCLFDISQKTKGVVLKFDKTPVLYTQLQTFFNLKFADDIEASIYDIVIRHAMAAEKLGPGAFIECIERLLEYFQKTIDRQHVDLSDNNSKSILNVVHPTLQDVMSLVDVFMSDTNIRTSSMLKEALKLAGFGGRIVIEKSVAKVPSVELVRGYTFDVQPCFSVFTKFECPRIFCIDGYIESVSEVHHLFEAAAESKETCVLFVRGLSDDVKQTVKVNYDRGSLKIVPMIVKYDLNGMNTLNDVAVVTGSDLVSSTKGDVISNIKFAEAVRINEATIYPDKIVIMHSLTSLSVAAHVSMLQKKRHECDVDDVIKLFDDRIRSLSPNHVVIRLMNDKDFVTNSQAIDYALRAIKSAVDYGFVDKKLTASSVAASVHSDRCFKTLMSLGHVVI